jgi:two-component system, sensor histidine kinase LadS
MGLFDRGCRMGAAWLLLAAALLMALPAAARDALAFDVDAQPVPLRQAGESWLDATGKALPEQVARDPGIPWKPTDPDRIYSLGATPALWIRFTVPAAPTTERWYLEIPYPGVDEVTLYSLNAAGQWTATRAGDAIRVASWAIPHRHPILPVQVSPQAPRVHLLQVRNRTTFSGPLQFVSDSHLSRSEQRVSFALGMYFGLAALAVVLAVLGAATLRDHAYALYGFSVVLMGLTQATMTGLAGLHLWPYWPWWNDMAPQVLPLFAVSSLQLFFAEIVSLRDRSRILYGVLLATALAAAPIAVYMMFSPDVDERLRVLVVYVVVATVAGVGVTVWAAVRGDRYAPWLLAGILPVAVGAVPPLARAAGFIPISFWTNHGMQIALAIELPMMLLVLMLRSQHRREHVRRIQGLDRIDPSTGLINAAVFHERLVRLIARSQRLRFRSAMLLVDIANIEQIRKSFDNDAAREITLRVAGRLLSVAREIDTVARLSEHRFGILMEGPLHADEVAEAGPRVVARCLMPFRHRPLEWAAHVRVAQGLIPMDGTDPAQLIGRLELLLASAPADSRRAVFMLSRPPVHSTPAPLAS